MKNYPLLQHDELEKYSSAISLSDMEIFVFPELLYSLVLANIMSPIIWSWREDPWFSKLDKMSPYKKIQRLKQFIIDHYEFNLDLDTWGLTTKEEELERFSPFIDEEIISQSNALFGYEGDKHYFSLDIRKHFGLDKYNSNEIPYWKTETIEAMNAFKFKENYRMGAGECVSLSTLYAAALFIICDIPLEQIFLIATPLHSQNFITIKDGILTNNRRLVTKNMWFNGTDLTAKAQRALRNEQVTIVANNTGFIHAAYPQATISTDSYDSFKEKIASFTTTEITFEVLANFLRDRTAFQKCFQIEHLIHGTKHYLPSERAYAFEHGSPYKVSDLRTRDKLLDQIDTYDFYTAAIPNRIQLNKLSNYLKNNPISVFDKKSMKELAEKIDCTNDMERKMSVLEGLIDFIHLKLKLPDNKEFVKVPRIDIKPGMQRDEIIEYINDMRKLSPIADLAIYASRELSQSDWAPFIKAAFERNPVCIKATASQSLEDIATLLQNLPNESIYNDCRMAQPDEVWNFMRGDGIECALTLAVICKARQPDALIELNCAGEETVLSINDKKYDFPSAKQLTKQLKL